MQILGLIFIVFGILFIVFPQLVAYIIAFFFLSIGINLFLASMALGRKKPESEGFRVGNYELFYRKK